MGCALGWRLAYLGKNIVQQQGGMVTFLLCPILLTHGFVVSAAEELALAWEETRFLTTAHAAEEQEPFAGTFTQTRQRVW